MESNSPPLSSQPADVRKSIRMISGTLNTALLFGTDYVVDKVAQAQFGQEVATINENPKQRKEMDEALAICLNHYFGTSLGPAIGYAVAYTANVTNRYSFEPVEPMEETEGETDESKSNRPVSSKSDSNDGEARSRENYDSEGNSKKRNTTKKTSRKKGTSANEGSNQTIS
jgi:hypothetical protein